MSSYRAISGYQAEMGFPIEGGYRVTPPGEPKVPDLVRPGMRVRTSYDTGGTVAHVKGPYTYAALVTLAREGYRLTYRRRFQTYTIIYVPPDRYGVHSERDFHWLNEIVAVGGRLLKLFEANPDEVFIEDEGRVRFPERRGQLSMF